MHGTTLVTNRLDLLKQEVDANSRDRGRGASVAVRARVATGSAQGPSELAESLDATFQAAPPAETGRVIVGAALQFAAVLVALSA
jgi:hypothetical protein